ncbi:MAG: hypothetical protein A2297_09080 [Elusimicrobia bacterium RIFOXYB2_FULL_48_7]|nr:MAG: hypothetical protein A2297_09080 [Elusimicrobia bacterium RIFOXYB2_FULL_48_7]
MTAWTTLGNVLTVTKTGLTLTAGTTYYFTVKAVNGASIESLNVTNSNGQFVALGGADTTHPVISAVSSGNISMTGARITWATDEPATSQVEYGLTTSYGASTTADSALVTSHSVDITGLAANTLYHYRVLSVDASANPATGTDNTFTTTNTAAPAISAVRATIITSGVRIAWATDLPSTSQVEYGLTTSYGTSNTANSSLVTSHSMDLTGLAAGTYHYRVKSTASSVESVSADGMFTISGTLPATEMKAYPNPCHLANGKLIKFALADSSGGDVNIYTASGRFVRKLQSGTGASEINWDGLNEAGERVTPGIYLYQLTNSSGNKSTGRLLLK